MEKRSYVYDPANEKLSVFEGDKPMGGFIGRMATKQFMSLMEKGINVTIGNMNDEKSRRAKVQRLRAIWISQGVDKFRSSILEGYGVTSTAELTHEQLDELIVNYSAQYNRPATEEVRKLRSVVLTCLQKLGVYNTPEDWDAVNNYLMSPKIAGKLLYQMNEEEIRILIRKLNSILAKKSRELEDELRKMTLN
jgi:hypothetical protein